MKKIVVGVAFNYCDLQLYPFLRSLEQTSFDGEVFLFVNDRTSRSSLVDFNLNVKYINVDEALSPSSYLYKIIFKFFNFLGLGRYLFGLMRKKIMNTVTLKQHFSKSTLGFIYASMPLTTSRFALYYQWLLTHEFDWVFLTDVSDVIFQTNVFKSCVKNKIIVCEEFKSIKLGEEINNSKWIKASYGEKVLASMHHANIYCAGTILGSQRECILFFQDFFRQVFTSKNPAQMNDQGVFNYMISVEKSDYFYLSENCDIVFTAATYPESDIIVDNDIINVKNSKNVPFVVHQYNRHKKLIDFVESKYI